MSVASSSFAKRTARGGVVLLLGAALALSACGKRKEDKVSFNGKYFASKATKVSKEERDHFIVEVRRAFQDLEAAKEAGRYEAIRYCIKEYGTSKMDWVIGPDSENIVPSDDMITLEGYCRP